MNIIRVGIYYLFFLGVIFCITLSFSSCSIFKDKQLTVKPTEVVSIEQLIAKPFSFEPGIRNFKSFLPQGYKVKVFTLKNRFYPNRIDSVFKFIHHNSDLIIYKASGREIFIGGNIYDKRVQLKNGVRVGISRDIFFNCFSNLKISSLDTIRLINKKSNNKFNFIFSKDKLTVIKIDQFID